MILDAGTLLSFFDREDAAHWATRGRIELAREFEPLVVSPFVIAELEGVITTRFGAQGWLATLEQLAGGAWTIAAIDPRHVEAARRRVAAGESLAMASVGVLAELEE